MTQFDHSALTDPALAEPRRELTPLSVLLKRGHERHMQMRRQDAWLSHMLNHEPIKAAKMREAQDVAGPGMQRRPTAGKKKEAAKNG